MGIAKKFVIKNWVANVESLRNCFKLHVASSKNELTMGYLTSGRFVKLPCNKSANV